MFEQNPTLGPGTGSFTSHTLEILLMLLGAFVLGLWLGYILWNRYKALVEAAEAERDSYRNSLDALTAKNAQTEARLAQYEADAATLKYRIDALTAENADYLSNLEDANRRLNAFSSSLAAAEAEKAETEIPMEIIESPIDVHVESLVDDLPAAEAADLVVETPTAEPPTVQIVEVIDAEIPPVFVEPDETLELPVLGYASVETVEKEDEKAEEPAAEIVAEIIEEPATEAEPTVETAAYTSIFAPAPAPDDLKIVEGIGPKIEQVLNKSGILTFRQLAETPAERIKEILAAAGSRYAMHDPTTWPEQSRLAAEGQWEDLKSYQSYLQAGRDTGAVDTQNLESPSYEAVAEPAAEPTDAPSYAAENAAQPAAETPAEPSDAAENSAEASPSYEALAEEAVPAADENPAGYAPADDLKVIEGIGAKIAELLADNGIGSFSALAATPVSRIKEILEAAGPNYAMHDPGTWPAQALLASNGEWDNLTAYQGFLNAGKRPV